MSLGLQIVLGVFLSALAWVMFKAFRRSGFLGTVEHPVSSGFAAGLADVNAMLQPQQPSAEVLAEAKEQDEEDEDAGDDDPPRHAVSRPTSPHDRRRP